MQHVEKIHWLSPSAYIGCVCENLDYHEAVLPLISGLWQPTDCYGPISMRFLFLALQAQGQGS